MKRMFLPTVLCLLALPSVVAEEPGRTLVNGQRAPLVYLFLGDDLRGDEALSAVSFDFERPPGAEVVSRILQEGEDSLRILPPGGMWKIPEERGLLAGYYVPTDGSGQLQPVTYVSMALNRGRAPVYAAPAPSSETSGTGGAAGHRFPVYDEPVLLDGLDLDWQRLSNHSEADVVFDLPDTVKRVERSVTGTPFPVERAVHWRREGTGVRRIRYVPGKRHHFIALETTDSISRGTYYYFRLYSDRSRDAFSGSVIIPVLGTAGPILYRPKDNEELVPVGQYIYDTAFLEASFSEEYADRLFPPGTSDAWTADLAVAAGSGESREVFTLTTVHLGGAVTGR